MRVRAGGRVRGRGTRSISRWGRRGCGRWGSRGGGRRPCARGERLWIFLKNYILKFKFLNFLWDGAVVEGGEGPACARARTRTHACALTHSLRTQPGARARACARSLTHSLTPHAHKQAPAHTRASAHTRKHTQTHARNHTHGPAHPLTRTTAHTRRHARARARAHRAHSRADALTRTVRPSRPPEVRHATRLDV